MKLKKKYILIGIIIVILLIIGIIIFTQKNIGLFVEIGDETKFRDEYEVLNNQKTSDNKYYPKVELSSNNVKYLTIEETIDILKNGSGVIYIGYAECLYCRSAIQVLVDTAKDEELEHIYYLDISSLWDLKEIEDNNIVTKVEAHEKYNTLLEELGDELLEPYILTNNVGEKIDTNEKRVVAPSVLFVVDGEIVSYNLGTLFSQDDPYQVLNDDQVKGLSEIYRYGIKDVVSSLKSEK